MRKATYYNIKSHILQHKRAHITMRKAIFCNLKGAFSDDKKPYKAAIEQYLPYQNALYSRTIY